MSTAQVYQSASLRPPEGFADDGSAIVVAMELGDPRSSAGRAWQLEYCGTAQEVLKQACVGASYVCQGVLKPMNKLFEPTPQGFLAHVRGLTARRGNKRRGQWLPAIDPRALTQDMHAELVFHDPSLAGDLPALKSKGTRLAYDSRLAGLILRWVREELIDIKSVMQVHGLRES